MQWLGLSRFQACRKAYRELTCTSKGSDGGPQCMCTTCRDTDKGDMDTAVSIYWT